MLSCVCGMPVPIGGGKQMVKKKGGGWVGLRWMLVVEDIKDTEEIIQ